MTSCSSLRALRKFLRELKIDLEYESKFEVLFDVLSSEKKMTHKVSADVFDLADELWFDNLLGRVLCDKKLEIQFVLVKAQSALPRSVAAFTQHDPNSKRIVFTINMALFKDLFAGRKKQSYATGDVQCTSMISCFLQIFLHEMCHVFVYLVRICSKNKKTKALERSHGKVFSSLLSKLFHQTSPDHALLKGFHSYGHSETIKRDCPVGEKVLVYAGAEKGWKEAVVVAFQAKGEVTIRTSGKKFTVSIMLMKPKRKK